MEAGPALLLDFLNKDSQFEIPIYQRLYAWKKEQCKQLLDDIVEAGKNDDIKSHFFGSVIYLQKEKVNQRTKPSPDLVIDGQQRLTTMSILLEVLARKIKDTEVKGLTSEKIRTNYLKHNHKYKLFLTKTDKTSLHELIDGKDFSKDHSRIKENFEFFTKQLEEKKQKYLEHIVMGMEKLFIIDVGLERERDNPQLIFESMNAKGMHLSEIDLIRNFLLLGLTREHQNEIYKKYWKPMENYFGQENIRKYFNRFVRDYLTIKTKKNTIPTFKTIYKEFKKFQLKNYPLKEHVTDLLFDLEKFAKYYTNIFLDKEEEPQLKQAFKNLVELEAKVSAPFLLQVYDDYDNQKLLSLNDFVEILQLTESYLFRRSFIIEFKTNSLNHTFAKFYNNIEKEDYLESIKLAYQNLEDYKRFPTDEEFKESIENKNNNGAIHYFLKRWENLDRKEKISLKDYTLEHIMPQTLTKECKEWKMMLGENFKQVHEKYLHNVGNLTLTRYNSEYSNKSFQEKKEMEGGFNKSPLKLNSSVKDREVWNKEAILDRAKELAKTALKIWKYPNASEEYLKKKLSKLSKEDLELILISKAQ